MIWPWVNRQDYIDACATVRHLERNVLEERSLTERLRKQAEECDTWWKAACELQGKLDGVSALVAAERTEHASQVRGLQELVHRGFEQTNFLCVQIAELKREGFSRAGDAAAPSAPPEREPTERELDLEKIRSVILEYVPEGDPVFLGLYRRAAKDLESGGRIQDILRDINMGYDPMAGGARDDLEERVVEEVEV